MPLIYEPAGRAREYAALACNIYRGCDHACEYCYAPAATRRDRAAFAPGPELETGAEGGGVPWLKRQSAQ
jgi:hypothetical protein